MGPAFDGRLHAGGDVDGGPHEIVCRERRVAGGDGEPGRAGVGHGRRIGAEPDDQPHLQVECQVDDGVRERPPRMIGLGADEQAARRCRRRRVAAWSSTAGHVRPVTTPSTKCIVGRRARWSSSSSLSKRATVFGAIVFSSEARALAAPRPASIHPSSARIRTGRVDDPAARSARTAGPRSDHPSRSTAAFACSASRTTWVENASKPSAGLPIAPCA